VAAGSGLATLGQPSSKGVPNELAALTRVLPLDDATAPRNCSPRKAVGSRASSSSRARQQRLLLQRPEFSTFAARPLHEARCAADLDEVISGFRLGEGGAAAHYNIKPDLATFGKVIGGGMPVGGFAGRGASCRTCPPEAACTRRALCPAIRWR